MYVNNYTNYNYYSQAEDQAFRRARTSMIGEESTYIYIYIYICMCVYIYIYIYVYTYIINK